jgi:hypothetical protein
MKKFLPDLEIPEDLLNRIIGDAFRNIRWKVAGFWRGRMEKSG